MSARSFAEGYRAGMHSVATFLRGVAAEMKRRNPHAVLKLGGLDALAARVDTRASTAPVPGESEITGEPWVLEPGVTDREAALAAQLARVRSALHAVCNYEGTDFPDCGVDVTAILTEPPTPTERAVVALVQAVEERLARGHSDTCGAVLVAGNPSDYPCDCGHDALATAGRPFAGVGRAT